jgi:succinate dehydrogenase / fumarate reductase, flavoprotein subunit
MSKAYPLIYHQHDVLVIGAGGAGLRAAVAAAQADGARALSVACISKVPPTRSHTVAAQGGINAALGNRTADHWHWHMYDTLKGSDWLGDQDAIAFMCERAPEAIVELEAMGMPFTRDETGLIYQRAYGGQRTEFGKGGLAYRACAVADRTGHSLLHTLYSQSLQGGVEFFVEYTALDLLMDANGECRGLLAWHMETGELHVFQAHVTIIATGGFGQVYASTTASTICTGDGNAMCLRAGLALQDMEFIQFHPTGLHGTGILITEGARGEGAYLLNGKGERFMERYAPQSMELASRDIISRAMMQEILAGRGCGPNADHLQLQLSHLPASLIDSKLPSIKEIARTFARVDVQHAPVPVLPAVHYTMGGIPTNAQSQVVTAQGDVVEGLLAIGEAACTSVHGANRLGCNALLELVVFGKAAGEQAAEKLARVRAHAPLPSHILEAPLARFDALRTGKGEQRANAARKGVQQVMQQHANIFRTQALLETGIEKMLALFAAGLAVGDTSLIWNNDLLDAIEADNLRLLGMATLASAAHRTESRGAHWREDFPARDDANWLTHTLVKVDAHGAATLSRRDVRMEHIKNEETSGSTTRSPEEIPYFPPEARAY